MRMTKKSLSLLSAVALLGVGSMPAVSAATSEASVNFLAPTTAPDILNPDAPNENATDDQIEEGIPTDEFGVLTLDFVSNFYFGDHALSSRSESYAAENTTTPFAQVTDVRGTGNGWQLTAELGNFTSDTTTEVSLPGASILLNNGQVVASTETAVGENIVSTPAETIELASGNAVTITTAAFGQGRGSWLTIWQDNDGNAENGNGNVTLEVPAAVATAGGHTATISWTLYDAPTGGQEVVNPSESDTP